MNFFEEIINIFKQTTNDIPTNYGWYHLMWFIIVVLESILLCKIIKKNNNEKTFRTIVKVFTFIILFTETMKLLSFTMHNDNNEITWDFQWYAFPLAFCSLPLYIYPLFLMSKKGKYQDSLIGIMSTFIMLGGMLVMFYPGGVFCKIMYINMQTMIHHGTQVIIGVCTIYYYKDKLNWKLFFRGFVAFGVCCLIASLINEVFPLLNEDAMDLNAFQIGRGRICSIPILTNIQALINSIFGSTSIIGSILFVLTYVLGFGLLGAFIFFIEKFIIKKTIKK